MVNKATIILLPSPRHPVRIQAAEAIASEPPSGDAMMRGRQEDLKNGWQVNIDKYLRSIKQGYPLVN